MRLVYDPVKNKANIAKHEMELTVAEHFDWAEALIEPDTRKDYGETRYNGARYD